MLWYNVLPVGLAHVHRQIIFKIQSSIFLNVRKRENGRGASPKYELHGLSDSLLAIHQKYLVIF
jgi:hypothetical protein